MLDEQAVRAIVTQTLEVRVHAAVGNAGVAALRELYSLLPRLLARVDLTSHTHPIVVLRSAAPSALPFKSTAVSSKDPLEFGQLAKGAPAVVLDEGGGAYRVWHEAADALALSQSSLVYVLDSAGERIVTKGQTIDVVGQLQGERSVFSFPSFPSLKAALEDYRSRMARSCSCPLLEPAFHQPRRYFLTLKPEHHMRRSLHNYLRIVLPRATVLPEQKVNEDHPVDVRVIWDDQQDMALIEVKWLGRSKGKTGGVKTPYAASRAVVGAQQLADYLDQQAKSSPQRRLRGCLVVFDARRKFTGLEVKTKADSLKYQAEEIVFPVDHARTRTDFDVPLRFFVEPNWVP